MPRRKVTCPARAVLLAALALAAGGSRLPGYTFELIPQTTTIQNWPVGTVASPTQVQMTLQLQESPAPTIATTLTDGSTSWNQVAQAALADWNQYVATLKFSSVISSAALPTSKSVTNNNNVLWGSTVYGESWGSAGGDAVGITIIWTETHYINNVPTGTNVAETDVLFNTNVAWDSYRGALVNNVSDLRRVALHEFGHVLGLNHPDQATPAQNVKAIMNSVTSATDDLTVDDIGGGEYIYGAPGLLQVGAAPVSQTAIQQGSATFSAAFTGLGPVTYQWLKNGLPITGSASATTSTLTLANVQPSDAATYSVTATNASGSTTSSGATLTVEADVAPAFAVSPVSVTVGTGRSAAFSVAATGVPAPTYQWTLNGSPTIHGATSTTDPILWIQGATSANAGTYTCTASNSTGTATASATLGVATGSTPGYLVNVSARANVGTGANILIGGFSITGTGNKTLLIRGVGPRLAADPFDLTGVVSDPFLALYNSDSTPLELNYNGTLYPLQNDNWGTPDYPSAASAAALTTAFNLVGAFPLTQLDAAMLPTLTISGSAGCSVEVSGVGGVSGEGLVEVYDTGTDADAPAVRLTNVSARNFVGPPGGILFGGFGITGNTAITLLIRGVGPRLAGDPFDLAGVLAQPILTILNSSQQVIYTDTGWANDATLALAEANVGAFPVLTGSADSLLLVTISPGSYSIEISGANGTTGIALMEVYEVY